MSFVHKLYSTLIHVVTNIQLTASKMLLNLERRAGQILPSQSLSTLCEPPVFHLSTRCVQVHAATGMFKQTSAGVLKEKMPNFSSGILICTSRQ